jgi:AcrR family transcriptional regulator
MTRPLRQLERRSQRKSQVLAASARLFQERGYHNVSVDDIAAAVGLTGPALYRHFRNKHDILEQALNEHLSAVEAAISRARTGPDVFARFLTELGELVVDVDEALLWKRERRHLPAGERARFRQRFRAVRDDTAGIIREARPEMPAENVDVYVWAVLSAFANSRVVRAVTEPAAAVDLLGRMARAIVACDLNPSAAGPPAGPPAPPAARAAGPMPPAPPAPPASPAARVAEPMPPRRPAGRRERILDAAMRLFADRGYYAVGIEEIAEDSETAIVTVYQHFVSKADLLQAVLARGTEGVHYVTAHRLAKAGGPAEALDAIVRTFVDLALGPHRRLLRILADDLVYLPDGGRDAVRRAERDYVEEWAAALRAVRPELSRGPAWAIATTAIAVVSELVQIPAVRNRPHVEDEVAALATAVLRTPFHDGRVAGR